MGVTSPTRHVQQSPRPSDSAMLVTLLFQLLAIATSTPVADRDNAGPVPVVLWHGMGDSAAGMIGIANILEENIPGVYVHRIMIGGNLLTDTESGFFRDTNRPILKFTFIKYFLQKVPQNKH